MTLLQLEYFIEICRTQNFTKAAEAQHVTQPVMTNAVKSLESEFGVRLIDRSNKELHLTPAGEELSEMALHLLSYAEQIKKTMQDRADEKHCLSFGSPNMTSAAHFPELFRVIRSSCPDIEIQASHALTADLLPLLDTGKLHLLLVPIKPTDEKYRCLTWRKSRFLFCVSRTHPLAGRSVVAFRDICREPVISYVGDTYLRNFHMAEKYREGGGEMKIIYRCSQINIMHDLIRRGEGCGFLIDHSFSEDSGIVGIPMEDELSVTSYLVWTGTGARLSVVRRVLDCVRQYLESGPDDNIFL